MRDGFLVTKDSGNDVTLGYWNIRGLGRPIRAAFHLAGKNITEERYNLGQTPEGKWDYKEWFSYKVGPRFSEWKFPRNLPYLEVKEAGKEPFNLIESEAILKYAARKYSPALYCGGKTPEQVAEMDRVLAKTSEVKGAMVTGCYASNNAEEFTSSFEKFLASKLPALVDVVNALPNGPFLFGGDITIVDLVLHDTVDNIKAMAKCTGKTADFGSRIEQVYKAVGENGKFKSFLSLEKTKEIEFQFNNTSACFQGDYRNNK